VKCFFEERRKQEEERNKEEWSAGDVRSGNGTRCDLFFGGWTSDDLMLKGEYPLQYNYDG
jgi:hypothetical protein